MHALMDTRLLLMATGMQIRITCTEPCHEDVIHSKYQMEIEDVDSPLNVSTAIGQLTSRGVLSALGTQKPSIKSVNIFIKHYTCHKPLHCHLMTMQRLVTGVMLYKDIYRFARYMWKKTRQLSFGRFYLDILQK